MSVAFQASLLDSAPSVEVAPLAGAIRRTELNEGAWIDVRPRWITGADTLFEHLQVHVPCRAERRPLYDKAGDDPRLLCFYADQEPLPHASLVEAKRVL